MTSRSFEGQNGPTGALLVGSVEDVAAKILRHADALGGISRLYIPKGYRQNCRMRTDAIN